MTDLYWPCYTQKSRAERLQPALRCPTCKTLRVYVATGAVCPEGHGGIVPCSAEAYEAAAALIPTTKRKAGRCG